MEKIKLRQAVIVEGKYDKIRLESVLDALILTTDGFQIYKNREQRALLRSLASSCGLIVLTDSDRAGFQLRGHISGIIGEGEVLHVYIPDVFGKEKRKRTASAEGKLGVEGMDPDILREAFRRAGVLEDETPPREDPITRQDFYEDGLTGGEASADRRRRLYAALGLPTRLSTSAAIQVLNHMMTREQYRATVEQLKQEEV